MENRFTFDSALMHFARVEGPKGFFWKYLAAYALGAIAIFAVTLLFFGNTFAQMMAISMDPYADPDDMMRIGGGLVVMYLVQFVLYVIFASAIEACILRWYVRGEGFTIGFGADELRLIVVYLIWAALFIGSYLLFAILSGVLIGGIGAASGGDMGFGVALIAIILFIAYFAFAIYYGTRLSPAAAITTRDRRIAFFRAWGATRGRFWPMFGAFLVIALGAILALFVLYLIFGAAIFGVMMNNPAMIEAMEAGDAAGAMLSPGFLVPMAIFYFALLLLYGSITYVWAGVPSRAVNTDPRGGGLADQAAVFE